MAAAQSVSDVFVANPDGVYFHSVVSVTSPAMLVAADTDTDADVWVRPMAGPEAFVDLVAGSYQAADFDGDGNLEVLSDGVDVESGADRSAHAPGTHGGYVGPLEWHGDTQFDFDGDGRSDLLGRDRVALSDGSRFVLLDLGWGPGQLFPTGDLDGDGRDDLLRLVVEEPFVEWPGGEGGVMEAHYELHLGRDLTDGEWPSRWSSRPEAHPALPATAVIDSDGDGARELVVFLEVLDTNAVELRVFGDLLADDGPTEWAFGRAAANGNFNSHPDPPLLLPVGDWDGDGDEDVLVHAQSVVGVGALAIVDGAPDEPLRVIDSLDLWERENPAYLEPTLDREYVGDFDGDGDLDIAVVRPYGVAFHGVDPRLLEPAVAPAQALGGCRFGGGGAAAAGVAGLGVLGLRRRRSVRATSGTSTGTGSRT